MQALSPGTTNVLPCEGGDLVPNNEQTTYCTDLGPAIVGFTHTSDSESAMLTLAVVDAASGEVVDVFFGRPSTWRDWATEPMRFTPSLTAFL